METLFEKLWRTHEICQLSDDEFLVNVDRVFLHERTGSIALKGLAEKQIPIMTPESVFCTMDHIVSTRFGRTDATELIGGKEAIQATRAAAKTAGITLFDLGSRDQGIVHVVSPELGIALPGTTVVCPDSHTCTVGGVGALGWGVGSSDAEHAMATNSLPVVKPKTMNAVFTGETKDGVAAKDMVLKLISQVGARGGLGYVIEYSGPAVQSLGIEGRMTLCNMAVEMSAFSGIVGVDEHTIDYVAERRYAPTGEQWEQAVSYWRTLHSNENAQFDESVEIDCNDLEPYVTWGTNPQQAIPINEKVPDPEELTDPAERELAVRSLTYMGLNPGQQLSEIPIDVAFIGSCTNSRISDLRAVAEVLAGRKVAAGVKAICVPGSTAVRLAAEAEGIHEVIRSAGFEWREAGCSLCFFAGGESFGEGKRVISSTNRNFEGRQGPNVRTHLASPIIVALSACRGYISGS